MSFLTLQDKLALALTSAGSQRRLAGLIGISHQKLGRWLAEGEPGGVKEIPEDAKTLIDAAFELHVEISRDQSMVDGTPFFKETPVYAYRPYLDKLGPDGKSMRGSRLIVPNTEYIKGDLRKLYLANVQQSRRFYGVSVRSVIDWYNYLTDNKDESSLDKYKPLRDGTILYKPTGEIFTQTVKPIYTRTEDARSGRPLIRFLDAVETKLHEKGKHATHFADEYLLQLMEAKNAPSEARAKPRAEKGSKRSNRKRR